MTNKANTGEVIVKKRQQKIYNILAASLIVGVVGGYTYGGANYENIPLWVVLVMTAIVLSLTVYYYALRDEYQRMNDFKHMTCGVLLAAAVMFPWYFAGIKGILPMPHILMTFFLIIIPSGVMTTFGGFISKG